jgi:DNA-binding transcriptional ArsR family regulator
MKKDDRKSLLKASDVMKTLSHPVRLGILCDLLHGGEMSAGDIAQGWKKSASQSQVSQYLAEFRRLKYVKARKEGQNVYYTFSSPFIESVIGLFYSEFCGRP